MSPEGLSYPKAKPWSERTWTRRSAIVSQRWDFRGVIDLLLSWRESIGRERDEEVENAEANSKYQERQKGRGQRTL
ncbi:hypothetical protein B296_00030554 [Ensete ventricosum]|uniref:Uncharacterized protein n=1 Tax=Ensete ventricosum TaxID=4639 RepID=A0A426Z169_ENSVE|nr:hypothetical protein B296_00030554 [Ensete ventricosum]